MRLIKKYPNRRLYDTEVSRYITLEDVRELVLQGADFRVEDARTGEDITRNILLQIIIEQEEKDGEPIFSTEVLQDIVRFYGDDLQTMVSSYIETSLKMFAEQQEALRSQMSDVLSGNPLGAMQKAAERNLAMWKEMQERYMQIAMSSRAPGQGRRESRRRRKAGR